MDARDDFRKRVLQNKKKRVIEIVQLVCAYEDLPLPKVNFDGCPTETGNELGHYHSDENKICISEFQLNRLKTMKDVEDTTYHELAHIIEPKHGGWHKQTQALFKSKTWRPPHGPAYLDGNTVNKSSEEIRKDPKRYAEVNEDSDIVKFLEGRPTSHQNERKTEKILKNLKRRKIR